MTKLKMLIAFIAIMALGSGVSQAAHADDVIGRSVVVVMADRQALASSDGGVDLASSFLGLASNLKDGQHFAFVSADNPGEIIGPARPSTPEFKAFQEQVKTSLDSASSAGKADLVGALNQVFSYLSAEQAKAGSQVYILTGGEFQGDLPRSADHISLMTAMFHASNWSVFGLHTAESSQTTLQFLDRVSTETGGDVFELSIPSGLKSVADSILRGQAMGALAGMGDGVLSANEVFTSTLEVAPGTRELTMVFFKEDAFGSLRLSNPTGFEASEGDRVVSSVVETPHVVIWKLVDPVPGQWKVDARGNAGAVSAWNVAANKYAVQMSSFASLPVNEPVTLSAFVTDGNSKATLEGVRIFARIATPEGAAFDQELVDNGMAGDSVAGDGFYSVSLPPLGVLGDYNIEFTLSWIETGYSILSRSQFTAMHFPSIDMTTLPVGDMRPGDRYKVAEATVHVNGQPYAMPTQQVVPSLASNSEVGGAIEVVPQRVLEFGRAWAFDIFYTPSGEGLHTLILGLDMQYGGRVFTYASPSIVLSSLLPPAPVQPAPEPEPVTPPAPVIPEPEFPMWALAIPGGVAAALLLFGVYWLIKPAPYGYLYTDRNELVADLRRAKRSFIGALFSKSVVTGKDIGAQGLERVKFKFEGKRIGLNTDQIAPTIRVNNQPLIGETTIHDKTWIGAAGKLYSFLLTPLQPNHPEPAVGDD